MRRAIVFAGAMALAALAAGPHSASAQEPPDSTVAAASPEDLVFEREVFDYPSFQRRNPFLPLAASGEGGPRVEQVRLMGIIYSDQPGQSVAILGNSLVTISEDGTSVSVSEGGEAWYLKEGQSIGNIRVVEIHQEQVVVEVEEFGLTEQRIMQLQTRLIGGPR